MFPRFTRIVVVSLTCCSLGLHWGLLQSAAWVGMVISYSRDASFAEAVVKTFDGKHPCAVCKAVETGKRSERKQDAQKPVVKLEFSLAALPLSLFPPTVFVLSSPRDDALVSRCEAPPSPPPRAA
ncbi:MAG: hypothetical protein HY300_14135 [Verrucomicrobia bacterium]|nr:hypothetical protein [Verrucomicrobiota bacterium]